MPERHRSRTQVLSPLRGATAQEEDAPIIGRVAHRGNKGIQGDLQVTPDPNAKDKPHPGGTLPTVGNADPNRVAAPERRREILKLVKEFGPWNINGETLSRKYGVSRQQISRDLKYVMDKIKPEDVGGIVKCLNIGYEKAIKVCLTEMNRADNAQPLDAAKVRISAAKAIADVTQKYADFLERFGIKEKVADKVEMTGDVKIIQVMKEWLKTPTPLTSGSSSEASGTSPILPKKNST